MGCLLTVVQWMPHGQYTGLPSQQYWLLFRRFVQTFIACSAVLMVSQRLAAQEVLYSPHSIDSLHRTLAAAGVHTDKYSAGNHDSIRHVHQYLQTLNALAEAYRYNAADSSLMYAEQALALAQRLNDTHGKSQAMSHQGYALYSQGKYDLALSVLVETLALMQSLGDAKGIAKTLNDIGNIYKRQERYTEALDYYAKALAAYQKIADTNGMAWELGNMAATWRMAGNYDKAFEQSTQALRVAEQRGYAYGTVFALTTLGACYAERQQHDSALIVLHRALQLAEAMQNQKYIGQLSYTLGGLYARKREFSKALVYAERGLAVSRSAKFAERVKEAYLTFVAIYQAMNNPAEALRYQQLYTHLHDSLFSAEVRKNMSDLQTRIATEKKDREIQLLQKEQQIASLVRNSLFGGVVLLIGLLLLAVNRYTIKRSSERRLREANDLLAEANEEISRQNIQLADANAEISRQLLIQEEQAREIELANTQLADMNLMLESKNTELVELNNEKNEFLGIVAHDLKNPLNGIRNLADMMLTYDDMSAEQKQEFLESIVRSSERMFELIRNLLDVNAIERGGVTMTPIAMNIGAVAQFIAADYRTRAEQKSITLHVHLEGTGQGVADEAAVQQVLENLISNAVKYSPQGKNVWVDVRPSIDTTTGAEFVRVTVRDEGPGLSAEDMQKLFGKFARLSAQPTGGEHSTGLGLSIVKKMVEAMNGRVWCESELGKGATFIVEFPTTLPPQ
jgi:signal transduction histidine kinase